MKKKKDYVYVVYCNGNVLSFYKDEDRAISAVNRYSDLNIKSSYHVEKIELI